MKSRSRLETCGTIEMNQGSQILCTHSVYVRVSSGVYVTVCFLFSVSILSVYFVEARKGCILGYL